MTLKQKKFVKEYLKTGNGTQAALQVYDTQDPHTAQAIASENLSKPVIKDQIDEALAKNGITPQLITDQIKGLAIKEVDKISGDVKLKANIELLKLMGAYPGSKHANLNINLKGNIKDLKFNEIKEELKVIDSELEEVMEEEQPITSDNTAPAS